MPKSGEKLEKVAESGGKWGKWEKVGKLAKSGQNWQKVVKVVKTREKWRKVGESKEKWLIVGKSWKKWRKVVKSGESGEKRPQNKCIAICFVVGFLRVAMKYALTFADTWKRGLNVLIGIMTYFLYIFAL